MVKQMERKSVEVIRKIKRRKDLMRMAVARRSEAIPIHRKSREAYLTHRKRQALTTEKDRTTETEIAKSK